MTALRHWAALVRWDSVRELERKDTLIAMSMVSLITLFIFSAAIPEIRERGSEVLLATRGGILWVTFIFAGTIGIDRAFRGDGDGRLLEGLLMSPVSRATVYYARVTSTLLFVTIMEAMTLVLFLVLFNQSLDATGLLVVSVTTFATTLGFLAVGVILSAMTWSLRGGDALLRILLFPILLPVIYAAVLITNRAFDGKSPETTQIVVIGAFDLVFLGAGQILFEQVVDNVEASS